MKTTSWISLGVFAIGCAITVIGIGLYEAWWTAAFAAGGGLVGIFGSRMASPGRPIAVGAAASGAALLSGMSVFFLFGSAMGGGMPWLVAGIAAIVGAAVLLIVVRRLLSSRVPA